MDLRACFLGDSYVLGQCDETGLGWPGRVLAAAQAEGCDITVYNLGVRGDAAGEVAARAAAETKARFRVGDKKAVIFAFGTNDMHQKLALSNTLGHLDTLLGWADRQRYFAFVVSPPVMEGEREALGEQMTAGMAQVCAKRNVPFLNLQEAIDDWSLWWNEAKAGDGAHPGGRAYGLIAEAFTNWPAWRQWLGLAPTSPA